MDNRWTHAALEWEELLGELGRRMRAVNPTLHVQIDHHSTPVFPLRATASFSTGGPGGDEDVAVSLNIRQTGDGFEVTSDVARGDGYVVADGPRRVVDAADDASLSSALAETASFVRSQQQTVSDELRKGPGKDSGAGR